ncbi:unnamed protein product [Paramecium sonneborni]|uniref:Uncharacterized protein n=1 Tax=Paramecium sonneborni TaxID=65129 RepID=A0A8S1RT83_9CILI|nr:unnamed protein product [Paramecium sonneborni]
MLLQISIRKVQLTYSKEIKKKNEFTSQGRKKMHKEMIYDEQISDEYNSEQVYNKKEQTLDKQIKSSLEQNRRYSCKKQKEKSIGKQADAQVIKNIINIIQKIKIDWRENSQSIMDCHFQQSHLITGIRINKDFYIMRKAKCKQQKNNCHVTLVQREFKLHQPYKIQ